MKIIHTSDWHLGHILYEHDRTAEHAAFLSQLRDIVAEEKPDALLVSGDIYDRTNPSTSVQKMYYRALLDIHSACPDMAIIVTAGNHDSKAMLELGRELWQMAGVTVVGQVEGHFILPPQNKTTKYEHGDRRECSEGGTQTGVLRYIA